MTKATKAAGRNANAASRGTLVEIAMAPLASITTAASAGVARRVHCMLLSRLILALIAWTISVPSANVVNHTALDVKASDQVTVLAIAIGNSEVANAAATI